VAATLPALVLDDMSLHPPGRYHRTYVVQPTPPILGGFGAGFGAGFAVFAPGVTTAEVVLLPRGVRRIKITSKTVVLPGGAAPFPAPLLFTVTAPGVGSVQVPTLPRETWAGLSISDFDGWTRVELQDDDTAIVFAPTVSSGNIVSLWIDGPKAFDAP